MKEKVEVKENKEEEEKEEDFFHALTPVLITEPGDGAIPNDASIVDEDI